MSLAQRLQLSLFPLLLIGGLGVSLAQPTRTWSQEQQQDRDTEADPFPDLFRNLIQNPPEGIDPKQFEDIRRHMQQHREEMRRALEQFRVGQLQPFPPRPFVREFPSMRFGLGVDRPTDTLTEQLGLEKDVGLVVRDVTVNSPAEKAGFKIHDVLVELDGKAVNQDPLAFRKAVDGIKGDAEVGAVVIRKGQRVTLKGIKLPEKREVRPNVPFQGGHIITNISRSQDRFSIFHVDGMSTYQIRGKVADGKDVIEEIAIIEGGKRKTYKTVDEVPAEQQKKVQELMKGLGQPPAPKKAETPKDAV